MSTIAVTREGSRLELACKPDPDSPIQALHELLGIDIAPTVLIDDQAVPTAEALAAWFRGRLSERGQVELAGLFADLVAAVNGHPNCTAALLGHIEHVAFAAPPGISQDTLEGFRRIMNLPGVEVTVIDERIARVVATHDTWQPPGRFVSCEWGTDIELQVLRAHSTLCHLSPVGRSYRSARAGADLIRRREAPDANADPSALRPLLIKGRNFISHASDQLEQERQSPALIYGDFAQIDEVYEIAHRALADAGMSIVARDASVSEGLLRLVKATPKLPYDCGVFVGVAGVDAYLGSLVLARPTAVGQRRTSEVIELRVRQGQVVEVGFYRRRLLLGSGPTRVETERYEPQPLAASIIDGCARLKVTMSVEEDLDRHGDVRVNVVVEDENGGEALKFRHISLVEARTVRRPFLRSAAEFVGAQWAAEEVEAALEANPGREFTVATWRHYLERPPTQLTRADFVSFVRAVAGKHRHTRLSDLSFVQSAAPEMIQEEARRLLFAAMQELAGEYSAQGPWLAGHSCPVADPASGERFLNDLTQSVASHPDRTSIMNQATSLAKFYGHASADPEALNIEW